MLENNKNIKICTKCVSDETIPGISFNTDGVCDYCRIYEKLELEYPAGAVVTKDIPSFEVWAGVPAKFLKNGNKI